MKNERFDRQVRFISTEGQAKLEKSLVGIVGLGGTGSQIVQALSFLGIQKYVLIDDDIVEETNLNRLIGATFNDGKIATPKVDVAQRLIKSINPDAEVEPIQGNLRTRLAIDSLKACTTIFGCVDNDAARLILNDLTAAYRIPLIDLATEIIPQDGKTPLYGGRVIVACPGDYCLFCAEAIDQAQAKQELDSPSAKEVRRAHGYGLGDQAQAPAVVSLNGVVANLGVTEFMMMITGLREPNKYLRYIGERGIVNNRMKDQKPDCYTCKYLVGKGDQANIYRYVLSGEKLKR